MNKKLLKELAILAVKVGVNIQPNQLLLINSPVNAQELTRLIVEEAYNSGASKVIVNWSDDVVNRLFYEKASLDALDEVPEYTIGEKEYFVASGGAVISITSPNPTIYQGIDPKRLERSSKARAPKFKFLNEYLMASRTQWTIIAYPNEIWAQKVFPDLPKEEAVDKLLEAILYTSRINENEDVIKTWNEHMMRLETHNKVLNGYNFATLHFKNSLGTDLEIGLVDDHIWAGGGEKSEKGVFFAPNIPTEETFTMPHNKKINGTVVSTKPLNVMGNLIKEFKLTFKEGRVVDFSATENEEILRTLLDTDEGSRSLGEVALISNDSPISNLGILFYNTLFDENASCHLALGSAYQMNVKGGTTMSVDELQKLGYNASNIHVDFMFGSSDMEIVGTTHDGKKVQIFRKGNFVI